MYGYVGKQLTFVRNECVRLSFASACAKSGSCARKQWTTQNDRMGGEGGRVLFEGINYRFYIIYVFVYNVFFLYLHITEPHLAAMASFRVAWTSPPSTCCRRLVSTPIRLRWVRIPCIYTYYYILLYAIQYVSRLPDAAIYWRTNTTPRLLWAKTYGNQPPHCRRSVL